MTYPKFSVVITTYRRPDYLAESLNSVIEQTLRPFEIIVVNDSPEVDYSGVMPMLDDAEVKYCQNAHSKGANFSRNMGVSLATGDVVAFLDDDDIWFPEYLMRAALVYQGDSTVVATTCGKRMMHDHSIDKVNKMNRVTAEQLRLGNTYCGMSGVTVLKEIAADIKFDESLPNGQDWDFFVRLIKANLHVFNITEALYYYRVSTVSGITQQLKSMKPENAVCRLESAIKHREWLGLNAFNMRVAKQLLEGLSHRQNKIGWLKLCISQIGIYNTIKFILFKAT